jgi:hypothetical protein
LRDFAWWTGLTLKDARRAVSAVEAELSSDSNRDKTYYFGGTGPTVTALAESAVDSCEACLLPWFDEFLVAYKDRSAVLDPDFAVRVNAGAGLLNPVIVIDGRVVGTWKRELSRDTVSVSLSPFVEMTEAQKDAVRREVERYSSFLGMAGFSLAAA